jgi:glycerol-3-phosphate acyltransferase PlsY
VQVILWTLIAFLCGSIPFSVMVGRLATGQDIRMVGDHNPGATNVLRAADWRWFALAGLLDYLKAAVPVGIPWLWLGVAGWDIVPIALAPLLGHAYSPWLRFRGGKAVAATFGLWTGLTVGAAPIMLGLLLPVMLAVWAVSGWAVMLAIFSFGGFVWLQYGVDHPELMAVWLGNLALLGWKHRGELRQAPGIRLWLLRLTRR